jgi:hypothetical protein
MREYFFLSRKTVPTFTPARRLGKSFLLIFILIVFIFLIPVLDPTTCRGIPQGPGAWTLGRTMPAPLWMPGPAKTSNLLIITTRIYYLAGSHFDRVLRLAHHLMPMKMYAVGKIIFVAVFAAGLISSHARAEDPEFGVISSVVSWPQPFKLGANVRINRSFAVAGDFGITPSVSIGGQRVSMSAFEARAMYFPFEGSFFVGAGFGRQQMTISQTKPVSVTNRPAGADPMNPMYASTPTDFLLTSDSLYISPMVGVQFPIYDNFFMTMSAGWRFNVSESNKVSVVQPDSVTGSNDFADQRAAFDKGNTTILNIMRPSITLVQFGYNF